jgi:hypothetical protein
MGAKKKQKKTIFVIMPFSNTPSRDSSDLDEFFDVNLKNRIEKDQSLRYQYLVRRSDDTFAITPQIIRDLYAADVVLCDLSGFGGNPNVMYELGVRLAVSDKPVILFRESDPKNKSIFDIKDFHVQPYSPLQYSKLEEHIVKKLQKFESGDEVFESPVLEILKRQPSVIDELNRRKTIAILEGIRIGIGGLLRLLGGAIDDFLKAMSKAYRTPGKSEQLVEFFNAHRKELGRLDWSTFQFTPNPIPAMSAFLVEPPLRGFVSDDVRLSINTFVFEFHNRYLASDWMWRPTTFGVLYMFVGESLLMRHAIALSITLASGARVGKPGHIEKELRKLLRNSRLLRQDD